MCHKLIKRVEGLEQVESLATVDEVGRHHGGRLTEHSTETHIKPGGKGAGWGGERSSYSSHPIYADYARNLHVSFRIPVHPFPPYSGPWRLTPMHCLWPLVGGTKAVTGHLKERVKGRSEECMFLALFL